MYSRNTLFIAVSSHSPCQLYARVGMWECGKQCLRYSWFRGQGLEFLHHLIRPGSKLCLLHHCLHRGNMSGSRGCDWPGWVTGSCHYVRARLWRRREGRTGVAWISQSSLSSPTLSIPFDLPPKVIDLRLEEYGDGLTQLSPLCFVL